MPKQEIKLADMKVGVLRTELEKRGLERTGIKAVLVERLRQALMLEEQDTIQTSAEEASGMEKIILDTPTSDADDGAETSQLDSSLEEPSDFENEALIESENTVTVTSQVLFQDDFEIDSKRKVSDVDDDKNIETKTSDTEEDAKVALKGECDEMVLQVGKSDQECGSLLENPKSETQISTPKALAVSVVTTPLKEEESTKIADIETTDKNLFKPVNSDNSEPTKPVDELKEPRSPVCESNDPSPQGDDDHDALHLTLREEEEVDKFMMEDDREDPIENITKPGRDEESSCTNDGSGSQGSINTNAKGDNDLPKSIEAEPAVLSDAQEVSGNANNHKIPSTNDVEGIVSAEGGNRPSSKNDERNTLHVTGLSSQTAATDLKSVFKKYGKIGGVKIMSNAKDPDGSRFALVAVQSSQVMAECISKLDGYELHGRIIHVEKAGADMLTAEWSRKEGNRDTSSSSSLARKPNPENKAVKSKHEEKQASDKVVEKVKSNKPSTEKLNTPSKTIKDSPKVEPPKSDSRPKPTTCTTEKNVNKEEKARQPRPNFHKNAVRNANFRMAQREKEKRDFARRRRENFERQQPAVRVERNPRHVVEREPHRQHADNRDMRRHIPHEERGRNLQRRFHGATSNSSSHGREISHSRSPFHRPSTESRRSGRQQEQLTFEDIYDIREKEKRRLLEREQREVERRRQEDEEKQRLLDQEIRMLARQRERIEQEKMELKRQKERIIMVEREKQRVERERLLREKEEIQRRLEEGRRASKRPHEEETYEHLGRKKPVLDERSRHVASYVDTHSRPEKEKQRTEVYRRSDPSRYKPVEDLERQRSLTPVRGAPMRNAPVRDSRVPNWDNGSERGVREKTPERLAHRDRETIKVIRTEDRREERKSFQVPPIAPDASRYTHEIAARYSSPVANSSWTASRHVDAKNETYASSAISREDRWSTRGVSTFTSDPHPSTSQLQTVSRSDSWQSGRDNSWSSSDRYSERASSRPVTEMPERWSNSNTGLTANGRMPIPVAPPPPIFSTPVDTIILNPSTQQYNSSRYDFSSYDKIPSLQRRQ